MGTCTLSIDNVRNPDDGRKCALRKFVMINTKMREEFCEIIKKDIFDMTPAMICDKLDEFVKERHIRITEEHATVGLGMKNGWYTLVVIYTIEY